MSFKIKKWAHCRDVRLTDFIPGLKAYKTPGLGGINTSGYAYPWQGKIICMCYDADDKSVWVLYDPHSNTVEGPFAGPAAAWSWYSYFYGNSVSYGYWGNQYFMGTPGGAMGYGNPNWWTWDTSFNFWVCDWDFGQLNGRDRYLLYPSTGLGTDGGGPTVMVFSTSGGWGAPYTQEWGLVNVGGGYSVLETVMPGDPNTFYIPFYDGSNFCLRKLGGYYAGMLMYVVDGGAHAHACLHDTIPHGDVYDAEATVAAYGSWGGNILVGDPMGMGFGPGPQGGPVVRQVIRPDPEVYGEDLPEQWPAATSPLGGGDRPWQSRWDFFRQLDGGFTLDELDLDGIDHHPVYPQPIGVKPISRGPSGWYYGLTNNGNPLNFSVYVMDPAQPSGAGSTRALPSGTLGWVGDYGIGSNLKLGHFQPFPDERDPVGGGVHPPQERNDGYLVGRKELFKGSTTRLRYVRDISLDLSSYPHGGDWWFPGEVDGKYPGFWGMFSGGGPTVMGKMPDPNWGMINPMGQNCLRFLGVPTENLRALEPLATHVLRDNQVVTGIEPITLTVNAGLREQLISALDGSRFVLTTSGLRLGAMPAWNARVGHLHGTVWTTDLDFEEVGPPGLGETNWTVWSVVPIPTCRALPKGGWLVGATLYFDPWDEDDWEWTPGAREATFMSTGNGWVPAKLGWDGPLNNDDHHPILLTSYDEWTLGRSCYGPDALLAYDLDGTFVKCLNSLDVHAPDGREVMVTGEQNPKLIFRIYRHGTYSDFAEGFGMYHRLGSNEEIQAPLYAVYDLLNGGQLGPTNFQGFVDMYTVGNYSPQNNVWRWGVANTLYAWDDPRNLWAPPGASYVRSGKGGGGITLLSPGPGSSRVGVKGVGVRG